MSTIAARLSKDVGCNLLFRIEIDEDPMSGSSSLSCTPAKFKKSARFRQSGPSFRKVSRKVAFVCPLSEK